MHRIVKAILTAYVLFLCLRFVSTNETNLSSSFITTTLSSRTTISDINSTDVWSEYSHEHIAVQKWRKNDAHIRELCLKIYNKILPYVINGGKDFDLSQKCSRAIMKTLAGLKQYKIWTFKMLDASGKIPTGILIFNTRTFGNYDECLEVDVPGQFQGQYCNVDIIHPLPEHKPFTHPLLMLPEFENFSRSVSKDSVTADILSHLGLASHGSSATAICVPSACSKEEVQKLVNKVIEKLGTNVDFVIRSCEVLQEKYEFGSAEIAIMTVLGILLFLAITATVVDVFLKLATENESYQENLSLLTKYLLCFSFYTNTRRLVAPDNSMDTIKVFHGMRVFSILWILLGHTYGLQNFHATTFPRNFIDYNGDISFLLIHQGYLAVDTFFFISSLVHSYALMTLKDIKMNYIVHIIRRILRLLIPFVFVVASVFVIPYLGSGPVWKETIERHLTGNCRTRWWYNLLFVNNFLRRSEMCLPWSWYIPADFQLFLLSLLVVIPMRSKPRLAFAINSLIFLGGICISAHFLVYYGIAHVPLNAGGHPDDYSYLLEKEHFQIYEHTSSCCIGLLVGYFLATRPFKLTINWKINVALWLSAIILSLTIIFGMHEWNQGNIPSIPICVLYKCTKRVWWCLALAWVTISCTTGNCGIVYDILAWPGFVSLARLTYMVYLVHPIVIYTYIGSTRTLIPLEHRSLVYTYLGNVVFSYMLAYIYTLLFESPFTALQNIIFSSFIPEDLKKLKTSNNLKKEVAEMTNKHLISVANAKSYNSTGHQDMTEKGYSSMNYQTLPD